MDRRESIRTSNPALWLAAGFALFAVVFGPLILFPRAPHELHLRTGSLLLLAVASLAGLLRSAARLPLRESLGTGALLLLCFYAASDIAYRPYGYPQGKLGLLAFAFACAAAAAISALLRERYLILLGMATLCAGAAGFLGELGGGMIFSDDHPCFLYRLQQLKDNFPAIPFYNPLWNAGVEAREFFASGVLNVFLFFSPIIYAFDVTSAYTAIVASLVFLIAPGASYCAGRTLGWDRPRSALAAALHATASLSIYRWALAYGTLGFVFSSALAPLAVALLSRFLNDGRPARKRTVAATAACLTLCFLWSPSILLLSPVLGWTLLRARGADARKLLATCALVGALNAPWVAAFLQVSSVASFVAGPSEDGAHDESKFRIDPERTEESFARTLRKRIHEHALPASPFVLLFGLAGLAVLSARGAREPLLAACGTALALGLLGPSLKPQLELERMLIVLAILLALPAADLVTGMLALDKPLARRGIAGVILLGFVSLSPLWLWRVATNETNERFGPAPPELPGMIEAIRRHAGDGRTLFAGFTLHELGGGHVAPLAAWTGKPLIASSYQHDKWRYTEIIPPELMKRGARGILEYMDLMNVSLVAAHDQTWRRWLTRRPEKFRPIWKGGRFTLFERQAGRAKGFFLSGGGEILEMAGNGPLLRVDGTEAVLKFRYLPFLEFPGCKVEPYEASRSISLVKLAECRPGSVGRLAARGIIARMAALPRS